MHPRRTRRRRHPSRFAVSLLAATPLSALAADATLSAWGAYFFFAIVATVVIVLLLHEALDDESADAARREERRRERFRQAPGVRRFHANEASGDQANHRVA